MADPGPGRAIPGQPYEIDFTDEQDRPCNLFLLMSENGRGKTAVLEYIALLMRQFGAQRLSRFGHEDLDAGEGRVQLNMLTRMCRLWHCRLTIETQRTQRWKCD